MDIYNEYRERLVKYFEDGIKKEAFYLGTEFEHIIINKNTMESYSYFDDGGIRDILTKLSKLGWEILGQEEGNILGLIKDESTITLEPGGQLELSIKPLVTMEEIVNEYDEIIDQVKAVLVEDQIIVSLGYHPLTSIDKLPFLPKERYKFMSNYFKKTGKYAHNMMKGTASTQVSIDFTSEMDFVRKFRVANFLSPFISCLFDCSPVFEGKLYEKNNLRVSIWDYTDNDRSKVVPGTLNKEFKFSDYAEYILNSPPIIINLDDGSFNFTDRLKLKEIIKERELTDGELEQVLTMFFPDVRLKKYIEIRMADALPKPYNFSVVALIKGIFYNEENLSKYYEKSLEFSDDKITEIKKCIINQGLASCSAEFDMKKFLMELVEDASNALKDESEYLEPIYKLLKENTSLSDILKKMYSNKSEFVDMIKV